MGIGSYITDVALPSVTLNLLDRCGKLPYASYYDAPWEAEADILGGATRTHAPLSPNDPTTFWELIPLFWN